RLDLALVGEVGPDGMDRHAVGAGEVLGRLLRLGRGRAVVDCHGAAAHGERLGDVVAHALLSAAGNQCDPAFRHMPSPCATGSAPSVGTGSSSVTHVLQPAYSGRSGRISGCASRKTRTASTNSPGVRYSNRIRTT